MTPFAQTVRSYMSSPVVTVRDDASLREAEQLLLQHHVSGLAVVDRDRAPVGAITRTDLLRGGRMRQISGARSRVLTLPDDHVRQHMQTGLETIAPDAPLSEVATRMIRQCIHRVYVLDHSSLVGVVSSHDVLRAVASSHVLTPIADLMTSSLVTVKPEDPLALAVDSLRVSALSGLVVVDRDWPIGVFGQREALEARDAPPQDFVESWMSASVVCLPMWMPAFRAAAHALATGARCLLPVDSMKVRGIVTALDFARLAG